MRHNGLRIVLLLALVICYTNAKRFGGGGGGRKSGSSWGGFGKSKPSQSRPSSTSSHNSGKTSSSDFLHAESGRPSYSNPSAHSAPSRPSAPPQNHYGGSSGISHDRHQQSSAPSLNSASYPKQPAYNPSYNPSPSHSAPPYPVGGANHPHPSNIGSSSHPSLNSNPLGGGGSHAPYNPSYHAPSGGYNHGAPPAYNAPHLPPSNHPPPSYSQPHYPPAAAPPSAPFVPGKTVYVVQGGNSGLQSKGPGLGTYVSSAVAGGVAAGATSAVVNQALGAIFRPSSNNVHTYPAAPAPGTPTSSVTNNYYYGSQDPNNPAPPNNNGNVNNGQPNFNGNNAGQPVANNNGPTFDPNAANTRLQQGNPATGGVQGNPGVGANVPTNGAASKTPENQAGNPPQNVNEVTDAQIMMLTEELFEKQENNLNQYIDLNLQKRTTKVSNEEKVQDEASEPLFRLKSDLDSMPTVSALRALYDKYNRNGTAKEVITDSRHSQEQALLDELMRTPVMRRALDWLVDQKKMKSDKYEQKDTLRGLWFSVFADESSSGFERTFMSEVFNGGAVMGMQNWIYFAHLESQKDVNYLSFVDTMNLSGKGFLLKLNYETAGSTIQNATIFAGTSPELEFSLYTICNYVRPNNWCPISLGGAKFFIFTHYFEDFDKKHIDVTFPSF